MNKTKELVKYNPKKHKLCKFACTYVLVQKMYDIWVHEKDKKVFGAKDYCSSQHIGDLK